MSARRLSIVRRMTLSLPGGPLAGASGAAEATALGGATGASTVGGAAAATVACAGGAGGRSGSLEQATRAAAKRTGEVRERTRIEPALTPKPRRGPPKRRRADRPGRLVCR